MQPQIDRRGRRIEGTREKTSPGIERGDLRTNRGKRTGDCLGHQRSVGEMNRFLFKRCTGNGCEVPR
ncbi:hypothetical protein L914_03162 [Phytophthora nicotianae]|uniref:Uncharacterized protein n=1 Tax=Phytophthora nicotianae TaxID=4792 RepID=W2NX85_PHYNI|nr:hypothetical protein L914_03162 [Phytophthora nicotianae]